MDGRIEIRFPACPFWDGYFYAHLSIGTDGRHNLSTFCRKEDENHV